MSNVLVMVGTELNIGMGGMCLQVHSLMDVN